MPYTTIEFAQRIKSKYPAYKDIDDDELTQKVLAKYPVYKSEIIETPPEQPPVVTEQPPIQMPESIEPTPMPEQGQMQTDNAQAEIQPVKEVTPTGDTEKDEFIKSAYQSAAEPKKENIGASRSWKDPAAPKTFMTKLKEVIDNPVQAVPFLGSAQNISEMVSLTGAAKRLEDDTATPEDIEMLREYIHENSKDSTFGYKVGELLTGMIPFAGELYATGGIYTAGKAAALKSGQKLLGNLITKTGKRKLAQKAIELGLKSSAAITGATLQTLPAGALRIAEGTIQRMMPEITEKDEDILVNNNGEDVVNAIQQAFGDTWIEIVSERSGGLFTELIKPANKALGNRMMKVALVRQLKKLNPTKGLDQIKQALTRFGYNGVVEEIFEERIGELGRGALYKSGLEDPNFQYKLPTPEQLALEVVGFSIPGIGANLANIAVDAANKKKSTADEELQPVGETKKLLESDVLEPVGETKELLEKEDKKGFMEKIQPFSKGDLDALVKNEGLPNDTKFIDREDLTEKLGQGGVKAYSVNMDIMNDEIDEGDLLTEVNLDTLKDIPISNSFIIHNVEEAQVPVTGKKVENVEVFNGTRNEANKPSVTKEAKTFENPIVFDDYQNEALKELADQGVDIAQVRDIFTDGDPVIREHFLDQGYDVVIYKNKKTKNRDKIGTEYFDLKENKFYAENEATAKAYSLQSRKAVKEKAAETKLNEGVKEAVAFFNGKNKRLKVEFIDTLTLQDQIDSKQLTEKQASQAIKDSGLDIKPSEAVIFGANYVEKTNNVVRDVIKLSRKDADITTVIEENAELYLKNKVLKDKGFSAELSNLRRVYEANTGAKSEQSDSEWFSSLAIDYAVHGKINQKIGRKLKEILNRFKAYAKEIIQRAGKLRKEIKAGKIDQALINELAAATGLEAETVVPRAKTPIKETVYHGTTEEFSDFDISLAGKRDFGFAGKGIYFTNNKEIAKEYVTDEKTGKSGRLIKATLNLDNALVVKEYSQIGEQLGIEDTGKRDVDGKKAEEITKKAIAKGYDGIVIEDQDDQGNSVNEYVVFDNAKITQEKERVPEAKQTLTETTKPAGFDDLTARVFSIGGGELTIIENSTAANGRNSISNLLVEEDQRRKGIASKLLKAATDKYDVISAQVSNAGSAILHYKAGFRPFGKPDATLEETKALFAKSGESLNMEFNKEAKPTVAKKETTEKKKFEDVPEQEKIVPGEKIEDFGEKIGGARKDVAEPTGPKGKKQLSEEEKAQPTWRKRYQIAKVEASLDEADKGKYFIIDKKVGKPLRKNYKDIVVDTVEDAEKMIELYEIGRKHRVSIESDGSFSIIRIIGDRKRFTLIKDFSTRELAQEYMVKNTKEIIEKDIKIKEERPFLTRVKREGKKVREGHATTKMFSDTFGFRGVEFGNWNNQSERQKLMDFAYDGLSDLAETLNIPVEAISLNGELALAFGARGKGLKSAAAHYERNYRVINLTKPSGSGALAHEWFHAIDHYFGIKSGYSKEGFISETTFKRKDAELRQEIVEKFKEVKDTILFKEVEFKEAVDVANKQVSRTEESLSQSLKGIRDTLLRDYSDISYVKRNIKPATKEQIKEFDKIAKDIMDGKGIEQIDVENKAARNAWNKTRYTNAQTEKISKLLKKVRGRAGYSADRSGILDRLNREIESHVGLVESRKVLEKTETPTRKIRTDYYVESREMDKRTVGDYWSTTPEMFARSFEAYVNDKIKEKGNVSQFLVNGANNNYYMMMYGTKPYAEGEEKAEINKKFDELVSILKTRKTDKGTETYQIRKAERQIITDKEINQRVKELREEAKEDIPVLFKVAYSNGVSIPKGFESDYAETLKKHKIKISKDGLALDIAIKEFGEDNNTPQDMNEFMKMLDDADVVDFSTEALRDRAMKELDPEFQVFKTRAQAKRIAINRAFKEKLQSYQEIKQAVIDYAKENLELKDRGKLLTTVKNAKSEKDLSKAITMMNNFAEKTLKSSLRAKIMVELKVTKVKKQSGKPKGKYESGIQDVLDVMRNALRKTKAAAEEKLLNNLSNINPTIEMARENVILNIVANSKTMSVEELKDALAEIQNIKATGRLINEMKKEDFNEDITKKREDIIDVLDGTVGKAKPPFDPEAVPEAATRKDGEETLKNKMKTFGKSYVGWNDVLDMLSTNDKTSEAFKSKLSEIAKVSAVETAEKKGNKIALEKITDMGKKIYGVKNNKQLVKQFIEDTKVYLKIGKLELTKAQARKRWMEFQDPSLDETFANMGYTEAIKKEITDSLSEKDIAFAKAQLEFYKEYYDGVNEVYAEMYGVNLPQIDNYSPIARYDFGIDDNAGDLLNEAQHRISIAPGATNSRTSNKLELAQQSDVDTLARHISDAEHFKAWANKIRELNAIFNNADVRKTIVAQYGKNTLKVVDKFIKDFTRGRIDTAGNYRALDKIRINFTTSVLGLKPALAVKQLLSIPAFAEGIPVKDFVIGIADFMKSPVKNTKILMDSEALQERWTKAGVTRDIRDSMSSKEFSAFRKSPTFKNLLMLSTRMGDVGAVVIGGWTNYRYAIKQGKSHAEAIKFFEEQFSQAQQSADLSQLSEWQRGNSFQKLFTMFTSSQNQYYRREIAAIRNLIAKRTSKAQAAKTIAIYHFVLPMLFQWVASGFSWDDDDQLRAAIMGSFNGVFILNDALEGLIRSAQHLYKFPNELPIWGSVKELQKAIGRIDWDDLETEDIIQATKELSSGVGTLAGYPVKAVINAYEGAQDFIDDDKFKGTMRMLGWSKWAIEQGEKKDSKTRKRSSRSR